MKKLLFLALMAGIALVASAAKAEDSATVSAGSENSSTVAADSQTDYSNWTLVRYWPLVAPVNDTGNLPLQVRLGTRKQLVENVNDENSAYVYVFEILGKDLLRTVPGDVRTYQMLVDGKWVTGKSGSVPKVYLAQEYHLFRVSTYVGVRLVLESADGKNSLEVLVRTDQSKEQK